MGNSPVCCSLISHNGQRFQITHILSYRHAPNHCNKGLEQHCFGKPEWQTIEIFDQQEAVPHIMLAMVQDISGSEQLLHGEVTAVLRIIMIRLVDPDLEEHVIIRVLST